MKVSAKMRNRAKSLRTNMTEPEEKLWQELRAHRLEGLSFRRQVPMGRYIVDFYCAAHNLVVELDGSQHGIDVAIRYDDKRTQWLQAQGLQVLRFWNDEALQSLDQVCYVILHHCGIIDRDAQRQMNENKDV